MEKEKLVQGEYYYKDGVRMEYLGFLRYNYIFKLKGFDDEMIFEYGAVSKFYESEKEMMFAMYGEHIKKDIDKLEELKKDRKDYIENVKEILQKISSDLKDNMILNALLEKKISISIAQALRLKVSELIDTYIEKKLGNS